MFRQTARWHSVPRLLPGKRCTNAWPEAALTHLTRLPPCLDQSPVRQAAARTA